MKLILSLLRNSLGLSLVATLAGIIAGIGNTLLLVFINNGLAQRTNASTWILLLWFTALCLVVAGSRFLSTDLMMRFAQRNLFDLRMKLSRRVISAPLRLQEEIGANRILAVFTEDIPAITNAVVTIPTICTNLVIVMGCLIYLGTISGRLLAGVSVFIILGIVTCQLPVTRATRYMKAVREGSDSFLKGLNAMSDGIKELKLHRQRREAFFNNLLSSTAESLHRNNVISNTIFNAVNSWAQTLVFILMGLLVFSPSHWINLEPVRLMGYILILLFMIGPLLMVMSAVPALSRANISMKKLEELGFSLSKLPAETDADDAASAEPDWHSLTLSGVKHTYYREGESDSFTLGPIDLTLRPGELVFMTGGNGSGKTTLAKLLTGLYAPEEGALKFKNQSVTNENRDYFRQHFSAIFSDAYIFETLLGLDRPELDAEARDYLAQFQIDHKVRVKDGELSTISLSQGQRKRLALLTAYLEDRPIYIFDEWAADQDPQFRDIFYFQLLPGLKAKGKTVVVISHDDRYYHVADRIIKLDYGRITSDESARDFTLRAEVAVPA
jgi:putative ATP-binding cassette transporter